MTAADKGTVSDATSSSASSINAQTSESFRAAIQSHFSGSRTDAVTDAGSVSNQHTNGLDAASLWSSYDNAAGQNSHGAGRKDSAASDISAGGKQPSERFLPVPPEFDPSTFEKGENWQKLMQKPKESGEQPAPRYDPRVHYENSAPPKDGSKPKPEDPGTQPPRDTHIQDAISKPKEPTQESSAKTSDGVGHQEMKGLDSREGKVYGDFDPKTDSTDIRKIAEHAVDALKTGGSLEQTAREVTKLIQDMQKEGKSEYEIRSVLGYLDNMMSSNNTGLKGADGKPYDVFFGLSGDGKGGFKVDILKNPLTKSEQNLLPQFSVPAGS